MVSTSLPALLTLPALAGLDLRGPLLLFGELAPCVTCLAARITLVLVDALITEPAVSIVLIEPVADLRETVRGRTLHGMAPVASSARKGQE